MSFGDLVILRDSSICWTNEILGSNPVKCGRSSLYLPFVTSPYPEWLARAFAVLQVCAFPDPSIRFLPFTTWVRTPLSLRPSEINFDENVCLATNISVAVRVLLSLVSIAGLELDRYPRLYVARRK